LHIFKILTTLLKRHQIYYNYKKLMLFSNKIVNFLYQNQSHYLKIIMILSIFFHDSTLDFYYIILKIYQIQMSNTDLIYLILIYYLSYIFKYNVRSNIY